MERIHFGEPTNFRRTACSFYLARLCGLTRRSTGRPPAGLRPRVGRRLACCVRPHKDPTDSPMTRIEYAAPKSVAFGHAPRFRNPRKAWEATQTFLRDHTAADLGVPLNLSLSGPSQ